MAANEPIRPPEATTTGTGAGGGAASAFEHAAARAAAAEPVITPAAPDVTIYRPAVHTRLVSFSRSAGHYAGRAVALVRNPRQQQRVSGGVGIRQKAEQMVRDNPAVLAGAAAAGYVVGRVLSRL